MANPTANEESTRRIVDLLNRQEMDQLDEVFAADAVTHADSFSWELRNRAELRAFVRDLYDAFPDVWWEVADVVVEGETVGVRYTVSGTHEGRLASLDPTGESFEVGGAGTYRFEAGLVVEAWLLVDVLGLARQVGATPGDLRGQSG